MKPILYLTSEVHNRDWDARLLMADYAVAKGFSALVGQQWSANGNFSVLPQGLVLVKTLNQIQVGIMKGYSRAGHVVAAMDEECFAIACDQGFLGFISPNVANFCDVFYANNPMHAEALGAQIPGLKDKIVATGNARMDLVVPAGRARFQPEADAIRQRLGPFILFNSNMAQSNSIWSSLDHYMAIQVKAGNVNPDDPESLATFKAQFTFEAANAEAFESVIRWCVDNATSHTIVIRPHPVERREYWENFVGGNPRVHIALNTHHIPWMLASDIVVHTNSTTGLEAAVMDKPTVNLMPDPDGHWSKIYVPSRVNPTFVDWQEATRAIDAYLTTGGGPLVDTSKTKAELHRYFPALDDGFASEKMVDHMIDLVKRRGLDPGPFSFMDTVGDKFRRSQRSDVLQHKIVKDFNEAVEDFRAIRRISKNTNGVQFTKVDESLFLLEPER